jgi:uncharacterized membrane protein YphA (DoxX/SURF4 family)
MKILVQISRVIIGVTFIFSGFVKMIDPLGTSYKLQEYLSADVLNIEGLIHYALPLSVFLIFIEFFLGVLLLIGYFPKVTIWGLVLLIGFFLFLTWYSAYYNKVTDCGCFGDAITLSPWQTFYKNVFFLVLILFLLFNIREVKPIGGITLLNWISFLSFLGSFTLMYYVLLHLPIIDFRPYAVGKNIPAQMQYIGDELPPVHDFLLESNEGKDLTTKVLESPKVLLVVMNTITKSRKTGFKNVKIITDKALKEGYLVYALSSSLNETFTSYKQKYDFNFEMLFCDETTLKTIIRANPGIVILNKGTVKGKWNARDIDKINL